jgi:hypothetical protein
MINKNLWVYAEFETDFESVEKVEKKFHTKKVINKNVNSLLATLFCL